MTQITDEMKVAAVKAYTEVEGKCRPAAMQKALEAALPFLPIAGEGKVARAEAADEILGLLTAHELYQYRPKAFQGFIDHVRENFSVARLPGKVKALEWTQGDEDPGYHFAQSSIGNYIINEFPVVGDDQLTVRLLGTSQYGVWFKTVEEAKADAQGHLNIRILSALTSSPGKDGGQEVEAVGWETDAERDLENRAFSVANNREVPEHIRTLVEDLWRQYCIAAEPQPASTALVERQIRKAGQVAIDELIERMDGKHPGDDDLADYLTRIVDACARAALSASTSREGER